jgi:RNA polymerase sigma factor (sigma-70 family)
MRECQEVATSSDPPDVERHEDEHLRRFLAARRAGDTTQMRRWWEELVILFADRMDGFVGVAHRGRLNDDEHELAVALAMVRFSNNLMRTFTGESMGQLVNTCKTLARGICIDVQRKSIRDHRHDGPSLDESWSASDGSGSASWEADESRHRFEQQERSAEIRGFLGWALPQVKEERRRVLELTFHGAELTEIAIELSITKDNAYQRRSRGVKDLKKLKERYDA